MAMLSYCLRNQSGVSLVIQAHGYKEEVDNIDSILNTVKQMLGLEIEDDAFDVEVSVNINSALMTLQQLGVGPEEGFLIVTGEETWDEFIDPQLGLHAVKTFVYLTVRLAFDPPATSFLIDCYQRQIDELTARLLIQVETPPWPEGGDEYVEE